jgi:hypothetical protein
MKITTQKEARKVQRLQFCYLCGESLQNGELVNREHLPPKGIFLKEDRNHPLILRAHEKCNKKWEIKDDQMAQLISLLHGPDKIKQFYNLDMAVCYDDNKNPVAPLITNLPLREIIIRFIKGFHSALYREFLPSKTKFSLLPPLPEGKKEDEHIIPAPVIEQFELFVEVIKKNRLVMNLDIIDCYNSKLRYECVWCKSDDRQSFCVFGLQIYNWLKLADETPFPKRGCVGSYITGMETPEEAAVDTALIFPIENMDRLNPFGL